MNPKCISDSFATQAHIVLPANVNSNFSLFGGTLMQWIDEVAGIVARRYSGRRVCTACVDRLDFLFPAYLDDIVSVEGRIIHTGHSSMIVQVNSYVEHHGSSDEKKLVNTAYLTMVALDDEGNPTEVPPVVATNEKEAELLELGRQKKELFRKK